MDEQILLNELESTRAADAIDDHVTRNLVRFGLAEARLRAIKSVPHDELRWRAGLPKAPFDMLFFEAVLQSIFEQRDIVASLLAGTTLGEAAGWDGPVKREDAP